MLPLNKTRITFKQACSHPLLATNGRDSAVAKLHRLAFTGTKVRRNGFWTRVLLDHERSTNGYRTSNEAIIRFFEELNGDDVHRPAPITSSKPWPDKSAKRLAAAQLDAIGI